MTGTRTGTRSEVPPSTRFPGNPEMVTMQTEALCFISLMTRGAFFFNLQGHRENPCPFGAISLLGAWILGWDEKIGLPNSRKSSHARALFSV